jgi:acyl-CoA dehydrogenase
MSLALPTDLGPEAVMLLQMVDRLAADVVAPVAADIDHGGEIPPAVLDALAEHGLLAAGVSELSDEDVEPIYGLLVVSRLARVSASVGGLAAGVQEGAAAFGKRERLCGRRADWVPTVVSHGVTAVGSDDGGFVLHGALPRVELGAEGASLIVIASGSESGDVVIELEPTRDGIVIGDRERTTGLRGRTVVAVGLDAVPVGAADVVGGTAEAERARVTRDLMTSALGLGVALGSLEAADRYAGERRQFGAALRTFPAVRGHLLEMEQQVATVSALLWTAARHQTAAPTDRLPALRAVRAAVQAVQSVPRLAVQVLGGYGFMEEYPVAVRMRDGASITARAGGIEALCVAAEGAPDLARAR